MPRRGPDDLLMLVTVHNRGPEAATIHLLPQLWFRNTWSWKSNSAKPELFVGHDGGITAKHPELGEYRLHCDGKHELLFCDNETNVAPALRTEPMPKAISKMPSTST